MIVLSLSLSEGSDLSLLYLFLLPLFYDLYFQILKIFSFLFDGGHLFLAVQVFQKGRESVKLSIFLVSVKGVDFVEIIRLKQSSYTIILSKTFFYVDDDDICRVSPECLNIFEKVDLIYHDAMLSVESMFDAMFGVDEVDHFIGVMLLAGCKNDQLV